MSDSERLSSRLTDLELLFTHLERQVGELNEVVLRQQQRIELLEKQLSSLQESDADEGNDSPPVDV